MLSTKAAPVSRAIKKSAFPCSGTSGTRASKTTVPLFEVELKVTSLTSAERREKREARQASRRLEGRIHEHRSVNDSMVSLESCRVLEGC